MKRTALKRKKPLRSKGTLKTSSTQRKRGSRARSKDFPASVKHIVRERSGGMCERCKRRPLMEYHHCIFRSKGKDCKPTLDNCLGLCIWCHKEDADSAHKSRETREWCVAEAKRLAEVFVA